MYMWVGWGEVACSSVPGGERRREEGGVGGGKREDCLIGVGWAWG